MNSATILPQLTSEGVRFMVGNGTSSHECLISRDALVTLCSMKNIDASDANTMDVFYAFEATIRDTAHRLTGQLTPFEVSSTPLFLSPKTLIDQISQRRQDG